MPTIRVQNYRQLVAAMETDKVLAGHWREGLRQAVTLVTRQAVKNAPVKTGNLRGGMRNKLAPGTVPLYGVVTNDAVRKGGFRYPWVLEQSKKYGHKGWFSKALYQKRNEIVAILNDVARRISANWWRQ